MKHRIYIIVENQTIRSGLKMQPPIEHLSKKTESQVTKSASPDKSTNHKSRTHLAINKYQIQLNDQQMNDQLEQTKQQLHIDNTRIKTVPTEDYVDLPQIVFSRAQLSQRAKNFKANVESRLIEETSNQQDEKSANLAPKSNRQSATDINQIQSVLSEQGHQWAGWNVQNLKILRKPRESKDQEEMLPIPAQRTTRNYGRSRSRGNKQREQFREKERMQREHNIKMVSNFLSGQASVMWLFLLAGKINQQQLDSVREIYHEYIQNDYEVPVCRSYAEAKRFLSLPQCFFKVVSDVSSSRFLLEDTVSNKSIVAIYIYSPRGSPQTTSVFQMKRVSRKVKGVFLDLQTAASQARDQIQNQAKFIKVGEDELERERNKLRFPSFIMLSDADKSDVTAYRLSLYGALKIKDSKERAVYLQQFTQMVKLRYAEVPQQLSYLQDYKAIDHLNENTENKSKEVLKFYVRETFYYALTNSILRLARSAQQFRPCTIPFNETYHAIKHYYAKYLNETKNLRKRMVTYRGAKLRNSDVKSLQVGSYIELLGFTSTSFKRQQALKFMDNDSYLIEIQVQKVAENETELLYDHGFVQINRYGLAAEAFQNQQQVLFNSLNVFKVIEIDLDSMVRKITLKYGAIFQLIRAKPSLLNAKDKAVMENYKYCAQTFDKIEDDGDVMMLAQEHEKCIEYYQTKIDQGDQTYQTYGKLAHAQLQSGDLDSAYENALRSLQKADKEQMTQKMHKNILKCASIFDFKEDSLHYQGSMQKCISMHREDWLGKVRLIKDRAQRRLKNGQLTACKQDIDKCRQLINNKKNSFQIRKKQIESRYFVRSMFCCFGTTGQLDEQKELQLLKVEQEFVEFERRSQEIHLVCVELENLAKQLALIIGNHDMHEKSREAAHQHFSHLKTQADSPSLIVQAKFQVLEATVKKQAGIVQYEHLMQQAIDMVKKCDPFHKDVGTYSKILGKERLTHIKKKMQLTPIVKVAPAGEHHQAAQNKEQYIELFEGGTMTKRIQDVEKFDYQEHKQMHGKCKESFKQAADSVVLHKGSETPEYLQINNHIAELDYDYSYLAESQATAKKNSQHKLARNHSQGAKCYLLLAKISLARGQLKKSFEQTQQSFSILRSALLKQDNKQYNKILINSPVYIDINLHKVKVFNRQLRHDLALRQLKIIKKVVKMKVDNEYNSSLLATIYEQQAAVLICLGQTEDFEKYILRAIDIREKEMGKYNIQNAICYSNLFKHMRDLKDQQQAINYHYKATEIFSRFSPDHPNSWIVHFSNSLIFYSKKEYDEAINHMQYCLKVATLRYTSNHITVLKIQYQYGKLLISMNRPQEALKVFEKLDQNLANVRPEAMAEVKRQIDDQKISIRRALLRQMVDILQNRKNDKDDSQMMKSFLAKQRCENQIRQFNTRFGSQTQLTSKVS